MKKEEILLKLNTIYKDTCEVSIKNLIEELKEDIRLETSYKSTNNKTKINAIKKVCKKNEKNRPILSGYGIYEDMTIFINQ